MITITIIDATNGQQLSTSSHRTDDSDVAIDRAIRKNFSQLSRFYENMTISGSTPTCRFGRIGRRHLNTSVVNIDYGHVRIDITHNT